MERPPRPSFPERVIRAAESVLTRDGTVGPLEVFQEMRVLQPVHVQGWRKGNEHYRVLEKWISLGPEKFELARETIAAWVRERQLRPVAAAYTLRTREGVVPLQVTAEGDPEREAYFRTHYVQADLPAKRATRVAEKLTRAPDIVVFIKVGNDATCSECGIEISPGSCLTMERGQPLCLACADLDHLVFLPAGDTALSRRSRKHSPLSAVVVKFSRARKRHERQGLLVTAEALAQAEAECHADAPERAQARADAALARSDEDRAFAAAMTREILILFPNCPPAEARVIAEHTTQRHSGRVGRSAAARALDPHAVTLAVRAHIRHAHTNYDRLLMQGVDRMDAREQVHPAIDEVARQWQRAGRPTDPSGSAS